MWENYSWLEDRAEGELAPVEVPREGDFGARVETLCGRVEAIQENPGIGLEAYPTGAGLGLQGLVTT